MDCERENEWKSSTECVIHAGPSLDPQVARDSNNESITTLSCKQYNNSCTARNGVASCKCDLQTLSKCNSFQPFIAKRHIEMTLSFIAKRQMRTTQPFVANLYIKSSDTPGHVAKFEALGEIELSEII